MHLYIITRGIKNWQDQFITELQGKYFPYKFSSQKDSSKLQDCTVQVGVRPIQLFEIVFPEEYKDVMLTTVLGQEGAWTKGKSQHKKHDKFIWAIRKALGCESIPEYKKDISLPITRQNLEIVGIGIKKDYWQDCTDGKRYKKKENENCFEAL